MTVEEAKAIVQGAIDFCDKNKDEFDNVAYYMLKSADDLGYVEPDLAVKKACYVLYDELRSTESRLIALSGGTLLSTTSGTEPLR